MIPITILLPVKNGEQFLAGAIEMISQNVAMQDEIVVVDDYSDDGTARILKNWQSSDHRVIIAKPEKGGLVDALNLGIRISSHQWIARFDVDDFYHPDRLSFQRRSIDSATVAIFSDYKFVDSAGKISLGVIPTGVSASATSVSLINGLRTPHPSVLFRREAAIEAGFYRNQDLYCEDLSLWLRLSRLGNLITVPETLLGYRIQSKSVSIVNGKKSKSNKQKVIEEIGINFQDLYNLREEIEATLECYEELKFSTRRTLLLLMDLLQATKVQKKPSKDCIFRIVKKCNMQQRFSILNEFNTLYFETVNRRKYRDSRKFS